MNTDLQSRLTTGPFWQLVRPVMTDGEEPVHYAHLRSVRGTEEVAGTLFLTSEQLVWRTVDPRKPEGDGTEVSLADVLGVDQPTKFASFHAFRVVTEDAGRPADTYYFPQHRTEVDRHLCEEMFGLVESAWRQHRALRASA